MNTLELPKWPNLRKENMELIVLLEEPSNGEEGIAVERLDRVTPVTLQDDGEENVDGSQPVVVTSNRRRNSTPTPPDASERGRDGQEVSAGGSSLQEGSEAA